MFLQRFSYFCCQRQVVALVSNCPNCIFQTNVINQPMYVRLVQRIQFVDNTTKILLYAEIDKYFLRSDSTRRYLTSWTSNLALELCTATKYRCSLQSRSLKIRKNKIQRNKAQRRRSLSTCRWSLEMFCDKTCGSERRRRVARRCFSEDRVSMFRFTTRRYRKRTTRVPSRSLGSSARYLGLAPLTSQSLVLLLKVSMLVRVREQSRNPRVDEIVRAVQIKGLCILRLDRLADVRAHRIYVDSIAWSRARWM